MAATVTALLCSGAASAQSQPPRPDPLDPRAVVPALAHASVLAGYRSAHDVKPGSWQSANETVNRIGGWRAYARETAPPDPVSNAPNAPTGEAPSPPAPAHDAPRQDGGALR